MLKMLWHILNICQFLVHEDRDLKKGLMKKYCEQEMWNIVLDICFSAAELIKKNQSRKGNAKRRTAARAAGKSWLRLSNRDKN